MVAKTGKSGHDRSGERLISLTERAQAAVALKLGAETLVDRLRDWVDS